MNKLFIFVIGLVVVVGGVLIFNSVNKDAVHDTNYVAPEDVVNDGDTGKHYELPIDDIIPPQQKSSEDSAVVATKKVVELSARNYAFSQSEIRVKKGTSITINLSVTEGFHDIMIDEFGVDSANIGAGKSTSVTFTADKTGTFEYYCSIGSHRQLGMKGKLVVE